MSEETRLPTEEEMARMPSWEKAEWNERMKRMVAKNLEAERKQQEQRAAVAQAEALCRAAGVDPSDPRLLPIYQDLPPGAAGLAALKVALSAIAPPPAPAAATEQPAKTKQGGATAAPPKPKAAQPDRAAVVEGFRQRWQAMKGTQSSDSTSPKYWQLLRDMRQANVSFADMGY